MIYSGDCLAVLTTLPSASVQCVVTSPPYWGLRDYGVAGQRGLEPTPDQYVEGMVEVFEEVRRVLKADGTLWLNLGDSYAGSWGAQSREHAGKHALNISALSANQLKAAQIRESNTGSLTRTPGLKPKDLIGIPWRVAFALQAAGWYLRSDIIWAKPNPMPESVQDRPTKAHEYLFLLAKSARYYYDAAAIREPYAEATMRDYGAVYDSEGTKDYAAHGVQNPSAVKKRIKDKQRGHGRRHAGFNDRWDAMEKVEQQVNGANKRSVWTVPTQPFPDAHFATFPEALIEPCILAGSRQGDTVLDPFAGSGTVGVVCAKAQRQFIGIELNPEYVAMAERRIGNVAPLFHSVVNE